ncbi:MAG: acetyl-CoA carboxylase carboxyltransferase subunit beta [Clostridiales bacterium]|nr:acetyl-CoA carboxylase carboxyltransferase subunit beta [Clostridiales bacterium]PWM20857.1 MAG: acetyl-CoA carboxylase carboxyl transferase subunit beta [Clostridiales bacterium]
MISKNFFKRAKNELEGVIRPQKSENEREKNQEKGKTGGFGEAAEELWTSCASCKALILKEDLTDHLYVCPKCGYYYRLTARQRIALFTDRDSFTERDGDMKPKNLLKFPDYNAKLKKATEDSGENESVICGTARIGGYPCGVFVMEPRFMMGSMGSVTGEKITRLFEYAAEARLPVIGFTASGGARMQEGTLSLMQMAKTSGAVKRHSDRGLLYITVLTDPTTGGVTASFAMEGDVIVAEPGALIGFAGPRVIEQTINQKLPEGFQRSEFLLEKGFVDRIVERRDLKEFFITMLRLHKR